MRSVPVCAVFFPSTNTSAAGCGRRTEMMRQPPAFAAGTGAAEGRLSTTGHTDTDGCRGRGDAAYTPTHPYPAKPGASVLRHWRTRSLLPNTPGSGPYT